MSCCYSWDSYNQQAYHLFFQQFRYKWDLRLGKKINTDTNIPWSSICTLYISPIAILPLHKDVREDISSKIEMVFLPVWPSVC